MKRTTLPLSLLIIALWASLQPADVLSFSATFMNMRKTLTLLLGVLALGWMSVSMLLALHPAWLERRLGGLDKLYATHKWTGIGAVLLVVAHWLLILSPRTLAAWGWIETLGQRSHGRQEGFSLMHLAREMGEWGAWLMIVVGIVALLRFVPYGWFRKLHKAFPVAFLIGAFHSVVLLPDEMRLTPFGVLVVVLALAGSLIAVVSLSGRIGRNHRHTGKVASADLTPAGVLDLKIAVGSDWPGHQAGQFALLTIDPKEGAHPFTIISNWQRGGQLHFAIKPLGDYTGTLAGRVSAGDHVFVEGPYGRFDFGALNAGESQVWVAGGIGVAPFVARLEALTANGGAKTDVHFFYSAKTRNDVSFPAGLGALCQRAGVHLHLRSDDKEGPFAADDIGQFVRHAKSVWFCGPAAWGRSLQQALQRTAGLSSAHFHREHFEFR